MKVGNILLNTKTNKMSVCTSVEPLKVQRYHNGWYRHFKGNASDYIVLTQAPSGFNAEVEYLDLLRISKQLTK